MFSGDALSIDALSIVGDQPFRNLLASKIALAECRRVNTVSNGSAANDFTLPQLV